ADAGRDEASVAAAGNGLDADAECLTGLGQPLAPIAEVAARRTFEATRGERAQNRHDPFGVMAVRRRDIDRQRNAVFLNRDLDLDATDLLAAINAALKTAWAERQERLSITTTLGSGVSPQARRQ